MLAQLPSRQCRSHVRTPLDELLACGMQREWSQAYSRTRHYGHACGMRDVGWARGRMLALR